MFLNNNGCFKKFCFVFFLEHFSVLEKHSTFKHYYDDSLSSCDNFCSIRCRKLVYPVSTECVQDKLF